MKTPILLTSLALGLAPLAGCGGDPAPVQAGRPSPSETEPSGGTEEAWTLTPCRIVDGAEEGTLLLTGLEDGSLYTLRTDGLAVVMDGGSSGAGELRDGMVVEIGHTGTILETYPAQFADARTISGDSASVDDRCGLYLQVLEDLWAAGLGEGRTISHLGIDLSGLTHLTEGERAAVAWQFGQLHGLIPIEATLEEIWEDGYLTPMTEPAEDLALYGWEDGCFFSITTDEEAVWNLPALREGEEPPVLTAFDAHTWRSGLSAYSFGGCVGAMGEGGAWTYTVAWEAIS